MDEPPVCILMPCLNARRFLEPRVNSLLAQTFTRWEALVLDSGSTDGSWEFFEEAAARDARFRLHRIPREGLYAALNRGIDMARGDCLLIATCDDTMSPDFLVEMLAALARVPAAGLAVCDLEFIDGEGVPTTSVHRRLGASRVRTSTPGESLDGLNFRPAPHDSVLHLAGDTVYFSLTQLLVRTALARRAPRFGTGVGSYADFGWSMHLTNLAGTVHVPRKLTAWRLHGDQLSVQSDPARSAYLPEMCRTGLDAISREHPSLFSSNDLAALRVPMQVLQDQAAGRRLRMRLAWLGAAARGLWMGVERPLRTLRALAGLRHYPNHLKQVWIALLLRRAGLSPRPLSDDGAHA